MAARFLHPARSPIVNGAASSVVNWRGTGEVTGSIGRCRRFEERDDDVPAGRTGSDFSHGNSIRSFQTRSSRSRPVGVTGRRPRVPWSGGDAARPLRHGVSDRIGRCVILARRVRRAGRDAAADREHHQEPLADEEQQGPEAASVRSGGCGSAYTPPDRSVGLVGGTRTKPRATVRLPRFRGIQPV